MNAAFRGAGALVCVVPVVSVQPVFSRPPTPRPHPPEQMGGVAGVVLPTELMETEAVGAHTTDSGNWTSCPAPGYSDFATRKMVLLK